MAEMKISDYEDKRFINTLNLCKLDQSVKVNDSSDVSLSNTDESIESHKALAINHDGNKDRIARFNVKAKRKTVKRSKCKIKKKVTSSNWMRNNENTVFQKSDKTSSNKVHL